MCLDQSYPQFNFQIVVDIGGQIIQGRMISSGGRCQDVQVNPLSLLDSSNNVETKKNIILNTRFYLLNKGPSIILEFAPMKLCRIFFEDSFDMFDGSLHYTGFGSHA